MVFAVGEKCLVIQLGNACYFSFQNFLSPKQVLGYNFTNVMELKLSAVKGF